ncbi:hypothetical protein Tco_1551016 [Tanacetum coccineum]
MVVSECHLRAYKYEIDKEHAYINDPNLFSIKIHHGGYFTNPPNREYKKGTFNYFDMVDVDLFLVIDLDDMLYQLGYGKKDIMHYHYKILNNSLDYGLLALASDVDVNDMEQGSDRLHVTDMGHGSNRVHGTDIGQGNDSDEEQGSKEDDSEEDDSNEEDSDYIDDEDHMMNEVEVDMKGYLENIDKEIEWVGPSNENVYENEVENFEHGINLDDFESTSDS